jgi:hypothetical protein
VSKILEELLLHRTVATGGISRDTVEVVVGDLISGDELTVSNSRKENLELSVPKHLQRYTPYERGLAIKGWYDRRGSKLTQ